MIRTQRVLVVDDEEGIRLALEELLLDEGYAVRAAVHGQEALAMVQEWRPDVVLLDLMMPKLDGVGFCQALRELPDGLNSIPVILLSGARYGHAGRSGGIDRAYPQTLRPRRGGGGRRARRCAELFVVGAVSRRDGVATSTA